MDKIAAGSRARAGSDSEILRDHYREHDFLMSPEGILKVISVMLCIVCAVLLLSSGECAGAAMAAGGAALAAGGAVALTCLYAAAALSLRARAPMGCLFTDLVMSTAIGVLLLVSAILSMTFCEMRNVIDYLHGPLALVSAWCVTASAVATYVSATRRWDAARPRVVAPRPLPAEHDV